PTAALVKSTKIEDLTAFIRYFKVQLNKLGVETRLGKQVDISAIEKAGPDAVVLATGGTHPVLNIPGMERPNVLTAAGLHKNLKTWQRFLGPEVLGGLSKIWMPVKKKVVIIGGTMQGCELAEFLTFRKRDVTILDTADQMGEGLGSERMSRLFAWFAIKGVGMVSGIRKYKEISDKGVAVIDADGKDKFISADTVIISLPILPDTEFLTQLKRV
ncbi:MAG: FAD-dependent oxidoreductase, partial [Deltaproteobacteria bacterium]|nr:FAD-dependent oxidoreductase [Deltaproteobacteria bacterium]